MLVAVLSSLIGIVLIAVFIIIVFISHKTKPAARCSLRARTAGVELCASHGKPIMLQNNSETRMLTVYVMQDGDLTKGTTVDPSRVFFKHEFDAASNTRTIVNGTDAITKHLAGRRFIVEDGIHRSVDLIGIVDNKQLTSH